MENSSLVTFAVSGVLIFLILLGVGVIVLQIFLAKKESKWAGLILPIVTFGFSVFVALSAFFLAFYKGTETLTVNGEIIEQTTTQLTDSSAMVWNAVFIFMLYNIPTIILLVIYVAFRTSRSRKRAVEKMSVQDLG